MTLGAYTLKVVGFEEGENANYQLGPAQDRGDQERRRASHDDAGAALLLRVADADA